MLYKLCQPSTFEMGFFKKRKIKKIKKIIKKNIIKKWYHIEERKNIMSQRYSGKSRKDSSTMKKSKLSPKEKRKLKRENKKKW